MKYALLLGLVLGGFYIGATQLVLTELNNIKYYYENADVIAQNIANDSGK